MREKEENQYIAAVMKVPTDAWHFLFWEKCKKK